ncbi:MAG: nuclear transport factor 2 family protein [Nocardioidaceae bacterium]
MNDSVARAAVDALGTAFLSGDPDAVLRHFATTGAPVYEGSEPGEVAVGRTALRALLEELFSREERYSWRTTHVRSNGGRDLVDLVAEADLFVYPCVDGSAAGPATEQVPYRVTGVLEREPGGWRWRRCRGSEPAER